MRVLIAPQEFKGTLTAHEAALAIEEGIQRWNPGWSCERMPMADGGPGTLDALIHARGGGRRTERVLDPLGREVDAEWAVLGGDQQPFSGLPQALPGSDQLPFSGLLQASGSGQLPFSGLLQASNITAVVECASASGLWRVSPGDRDPLHATSYGTGQLIAAALDAGCRELIVGLGGSATNDGGAGMAQALGYRLLDVSGNELPPGGAALARLARIDASGVHPGLKPATVSGAIDVTNPLCGPAGASAVYGPQKGATPAMVEELDAALAHLAAIIRRDLGADVLDVAGAGAAGGLGAGLIAFLHATLQPGGELVATAAGYEERLARADVVITGEGRLDSQTGFGKGPAYLAKRARLAGKRCACIAGVLGPGAEKAAAAFDLVEVSGEATTGLPTPADARKQLSMAATRLASRLVVLDI